MPGPAERAARAARGGRASAASGESGGTSPAPAAFAGVASDWDQVAAGLLSQVQDDLAAERAAADESRDRALTEWDGSEVSYTDNPAAFEDEYRQARARRSAGQEPVPYMTENATGGLGVREGGRGFGVEIEFDLPEGPGRYTALAAIGQDLYAAGLTSSSQQQRYHAGHATPSRQHRGGWRFEADSTVSGEIVSPIMYDEPETWRNLQRVCEIVRRHGGTATARTGGHVHVALSDYDHTVENHNRLLRTVAGYQDTLYRLAQNPAARRHRGTSWCRPNRSPGLGYTSIDSVRTNNQGHSVGVNFGAVRGGRSDHVEFRMWDGSLNPGVIQAQVNLSLAMTAAGSRGGYSTPPAEPVGTHRIRNPGRERLRSEQWRQSTASFRQLADTLFRRSANSAQAAALFAVTRWQR
jgi:hypothetical protein